MRSELASSVVNTVAPAVTPATSAGEEAK